MNQVALNALVAVLIMAGGLLAYDRLVFRPSQVVGVVDVAEVYRLKEGEFADLITKGKSDDERQRAMDMARRFAKRLPQALEELPRECGCLVVLQSAVAGRTPHTVDLTARLKAKVDAL